MSNVLVEVVDSRKAKATATIVPQGNLLRDEEILVVSTEDPIPCAYRIVGGNYIRYEGSHKSCDLLV